MLVIDLNPQSAAETLKQIKKKLPSIKRQTVTNAIEAISKVTDQRRLYQLVILDTKSIVSYRVSLLCNLD